MIAALIVIYGTIGIMLLYYEINGSFCYMLFLLENDLVVIMVSLPPSRPGPGLVKPGA